MNPTDFSFKVLLESKFPPSLAKWCAYLVPDSWDDWFTYRTMYWLVVFDEKGKRIDIGSVKIGQQAEVQWKPDEPFRPKLPSSFSAFKKNFFSLGQEESYYENIYKLLPPTLRTTVLIGLRDIVFDADLFEEVVSLEITEKSLMRHVSETTVTGQFRRILAGGAKLTAYDFSFSGPEQSELGSSLSLGFQVRPNSNPPSNIHVLVGRNGVGKTNLMNRMTVALVGDLSSQTKAGKFTSNDPNELDWGDSDEIFANLVSVSFSAFDHFEPKAGVAAKTKYSYIGLKRPGTGQNSKVPKSPEMLATEFVKSLRVCLKGERRQRWESAIDKLEEDPLFGEAQILENGRTLEALIGDESQFEQIGKHHFSLLSTGHKIVLLTITKLVETVAEKSLVLIDEPEAHLHPPLLSAFLRAISELLIDRNGVAIIATHSPVVLQEVPRRCVWKLHRSGPILSAERPEIETFGENMGILTREVFGFQVLKSGFYRLIRDYIDKYDAEYEDVLRAFGNSIGDEAKAYIRAHIATRTTAGR